MSSCEVIKGFIYIEFNYNLNQILFNILKFLQFISVNDSMWTMWEEFLAESSQNIDIFLNIHISNLLVSWILDFFVFRFFELSFKFFEKKI